MRERLLTAQELSDLTGWHVITVYKKSLSGEIPGRVKLGKFSVRFKESKIEAWLKGATEEKRPSRGGNNE